MDFAKDPSIVAKRILTREEKKDFLPPELVTSDEDDDPKAGDSKGGAGPGMSDGGGRKSLKRDLKQMMYGFGDVQEPDDNTAELLETIVVDYIKDLCQKAVTVGKPGRLTLDDIHYLIRRDTKKFTRVKDLLCMNDELKKAKKAFEESKELD